MTDRDDTGRQPPADAPRPPRHLRVGIVLRGRSASVGPVWVVEQAAARRPTLADPILVRVDIAGAVAALETHPDPRRSRGTMHADLGHHFGNSEEGTLFVSVPFTSAGDLAAVRIRLTDLTGVRLPERRPEALAVAIDEPVGGMRAVHEVTGADLRAAPDWPAVARQLGLPQDFGSFEVYLDRAGQYRWRLRRTDGAIVADSGQGYAARAECEADLRWIREHAATVPIAARDIPPSSR